MSTRHGEATTHFVIDVSGSCFIRSAFFGESTKRVDVAIRVVLTAGSYYAYSESIILHNEYGVIEGLETNSKLKHQITATEEKMGMLGVIPHRQLMIGA